jgi:hypothetical protein
VVVGAASSATAVETAHAIVQRSFRPSADERVAALVYSASPPDAKANAAHAATGKLPLLERSLFLNW